jgi:thioredoxin-dependent peroxiredoxin
LRGIFFAKSCYTDHMLPIHSTAPDFRLPDQTGTLRALSDVTTKFTLIYFYPKDDTPGCTTESCGLRDVFSEIQALDCTIFGISKDSVASHAKFKEKYDLPFDLLSDESTETISAFGAWKEKSMYGKTFLGIQRMSYLLEGSKIVKVYPKVSPKEHAAEIIADLKAMLSE